VGQVKRIGPDPGRSIDPPADADFQSRFSIPRRHSVQADEEVPMTHVHEGQCGLCVHFGEHHPEETSKLVQIRLKKEAPEDLVEECGHPKHAALHLVVTPISGCEGFMPASTVQ
jgi:hypothetical protein